MSDRTNQPMTEYIIANLVFTQTAICQLAARLGVSNDLANDLRDAFLVTRRNGANLGDGRLVQEHENPEMFRQLENSCNGMIKQIEEWNVLLGDN